MIVVTASWGRKVPGPVNFSSIQGQASVQLEAGSMAEVPQRVREAFLLVEQAVEEQLRQKLPVSPSATPTPTAISTTAQPSSPSPDVQPANDNAARSTRPYNSKSRTPAPATQSQLKFLSTLIKNTRIDPTAILQEFEIGSLDELSCREAAGLIDNLKGKSSPR